MVCFRIVNSLFLWYMGNTASKQGTTKLIYIPRPIYQVIKESTLQGRLFHNFLIACFFQEYLRIIWRWNSKTQDLMQWVCCYVFGLNVSLHRLFFDPSLCPKASPGHHFEKGLFQMPSPEFIKLFLCLFWLIFLRFDLKCPAFLDFSKIV